MAKENINDSIAVMVIEDDALISNKETHHELVKFVDNNLELEVNVSPSEDTVWLTQEQISLLFDTARSSIAYHIGNLFKNGELDEKTSVEFFDKSTNHRPSKYYNLDVILAVGYRVNSRRGQIFRKWASTVLKNYMLQGYAINQKRLEVLNKTVEIETRIIAHMSEIDIDEMMQAVNLYTSALNLLDDYDHQCITKPNGNKNVIALTTAECNEIISSMKFGNSSPLFGVEKEEGKLDAILAAVHQEVYGEDVYPTLEEKAANLLYLLVKDHPFQDGCKRIAATLFLTFLQKNGILKKADGKRTISNGTLVAITLLIAESKPEEKAIMISVVINILSLN